MTLQKDTQVEFLSDIFDNVKCAICDHRGKEVLERQILASTVERHCYVKGLLFEHGKMNALEDID
jgi:hypothetical protein